MKTDLEVHLGTPTRILIVDDSSLNRSKLRMAVSHLGYQSEQASNGIEALELLRLHRFDTILLDLVMPEMDGFEVLEALRHDTELRDIPVIVISSLDDQTDCVVKAIELGAEDVLPKNFNPVLLKARLNASLSRKNFRDQQREYLRRVELLTEAAEVFEAGDFDTSNLELDALASQNDALGRLAAVFRGMAKEIYEREITLKRRVQLLQGGLLVLAIGVVWGIVPSLSRMVSVMGSNPLGMAIWVNLIAAVICLSVAIARGKFPKLGKREILFFVGWALLAGVSQRLTTFWVAAHVEAAMLSLIVTLQGFMVFVFAAVTGLEKASPKRLLGLLLGLIGVAVVLFSNSDVSGTGKDLWLFTALLLPLLFAIEAIVLAGRRPEHVGIFASTGLMMLFSTLLLLPLAYFTGQLMPVGESFGQLQALILLLAVVSASSIVLSFHVIAVAGSVFYSQSAYVMTLAGIVWGMLLLGEVLPPIAWAAFLVIIIGMFLVEPKPTDEKIVIKRAFVRRQPGVVQ